MPPSSQPPESSGLVPIETDRWRITPNGDDTFTLRPLTSFDGPAAPANTLLLTAEDVVDLANLFSIGSDLLNGTGGADVPRLRFVDVDGEPLFSAFGQPPALGAHVMLADGHEGHVKSHAWEYAQHGAATVIVAIDVGPRPGVLEKVRSALTQEEHDS